MGMEVFVKSFQRLWDRLLETLPCVCVGVVYSQRLLCALTSQLLHVCTTLLLAVRGATVSYSHRKLAQGGAGPNRRMTGTSSPRSRPLSDASLEVLEGYDVSYYVHLTHDAHRVASSNWA